jgi:hypothetical protein
MKEHEMDKKYFAVLTGDIIRSTSLSQNELEAVRKTLFDSVDDLKSWRRGLVRGKLEFFRGDAWQLLLTEPGRALRAGVFLRARLISQGLADSRISIGLGTVQNISSNRVSLSTGQAFISSGHGLDSMTQYSRMTIETDSSVGLLSTWLPVIGLLCDAVIKGWTSRQAEIVTYAVDPEEPTHEQIAARLEPTTAKQTVTKALSGANWYSLRECIKRFEKTQWGSTTPSSG